MPMGSTPGCSEEGSTDRTAERPPAQVTLHQEHFPSDRWRSTAWASTHRLPLSATVRRLILICGTATDSLSRPMGLSGKQRCQNCSRANRTFQARYPLQPALLPYVAVPFGGAQNGLLGVSEWSRSRPSVLLPVQQERQQSVPCGDASRCILPRWTAAP